ncbi:OmpA family protein [Novosphingobium tardum]|uniref:OmpA family protein n=1 Tax=Novosphingobium tardum TaxID=1538021 RepID=A0ABV8RP81_9SPHN
MKDGYKILLGAVAAACVSVTSHALVNPGLIARLNADARAALDANGGRRVGVSFTSGGGWLTRHPSLSTGRRLSDGERARLARIVAALDGIGATWWRRAPGLAAEKAQAATAAPLPPDHCQNGVDALLKVRTIRFASASAGIDPASNALLDEVAAALKPCGGSVVEIAGHTDAQGDPAANGALSEDRAYAVRDALITRGMPPSQLVARGYGAERPLAGLRPDDPANRRIEFSVVATEPLRPTPIDTPVAR